VPLRILALGKKDPRSDVTADVYLLTHGEPSLLPVPEGAGERGLSLVRSEDASKDLLNDLRSDKGMKWIPSKMWLSYLRIDSNAGKLTYDLSVGTEARGGPYEEEAYGVQSQDDPPARETKSTEPASVFGWILVPVFGLGAAKFRTRLRRR
jgi:hypothetical protein